MYVLGFPMNMVDSIKAPICRIGCIARFADAYIRRKENPVFLIDAQTFPGNSGGPVISRPETRGPLKTEYSLFAPFFD